MTHTVIRVAAGEFSNMIPFAVGIVELDDGTRITGQIVDCEPAELRRGQKVKFEFRRIQEDGEGGVIAYGYKFVPTTIEEATNP